MVHVDGLQVLSNDVEGLLDAGAGRQAGLEALHAVAQILCPLHAHAASFRAPSQIENEDAGRDVDAVGHAEDCVAVEEGGAMQLHQVQNGKRGCVAGLRCFAV